MKKISENTGLGKPARDFTVSLTGGSAYTLSAQKGRVVLVDFWSTSCPPASKSSPISAPFTKPTKRKGSRSSASAWMTARRSWILSWRLIPCPGIPSFPEKAGMMTPQNFMKYCQSPPCGWWTRRVFFAISMSEAKT
ncbi:MAG: redoxin family protein [Anaerotruncus sp.]|nr:redoxin family protein [Anaerotruncus sp.]